MCNACVEKRKPTPGPWIKWQLAPDSDPECRWIVTTEDGENEVCGIIEKEADAEILAAATELLAVAEGALGYLRALPMACCRPDPKWLAPIEAAIAKAKGTP